MYCDELHTEEFGVKLKNRSHHLQAYSFIRLTLTGRALSLENSSCLCVFYTAQVYPIYAPPLHFLRFHSLVGLIVQTE